jgi:Na+/H+ antiporter NhaA
MLHLRAELHDGNLSDNKDAEFPSAKNIVEGLVPPATVRLRLALHLSSPSKKHN